MDVIMRKNLLTVLILALLIVNIVLTSIMMVSVTSTNKKTAELVGNITTAMNLELTKPGEVTLQEEVSLADTEVYNLTGSVMMPLASGEDGKQAYLVCDIAFSLNKKHKDYKKYGGEEAMSEKESLIKDAIGTVVASYTEEDCRNDLEKLKADILKAVQDLFDSDFIYKVAISEVKFG